MGWMDGGGISFSPFPGKALLDWPGPVPSEPRSLGWRLSLSSAHVPVCVCVCARACVCVCVCTESLQSCLTLATPRTVASKVLLSIGFFRQEYWSGLPFPSPGDLPNSGIQPRSPILQADSLLIELPGSQLHRLGPAKTQEALQDSVFTHSWDFPGSPVVKILPFHCRGLGFHPWLGN